MIFVIFAFLIISSLLVWYLLRHDHGRHLPAGPLWGAFGFGVLAIALGIGLELLLIPDNVDGSSGQKVAIHTMLLGGLGVGVIEEATKFIPLALFLWRKPYFREHTDGVIYFAICGLTTGLLENIEYTLSDGASAGIYRLFVTPFFHAAATSILGYYLASYKLDRRVRPKFIAACVLIPLAHGIYDFGLFSGKLLYDTVSLMLTVTLTMGLFLYFMRANELDRAAAAATPIAPMAAENFCPHCGHPNAHHTQFCEYCGQRL